MSARLAVVIMAAGKGTRMKNPDMAKVMYTVGDKPMVEHVVDLALELKADRIVVVVGWRKEDVMAHLQRKGKPVVFAAQEPQLGTGHAVMQAEQALHGFDGDVLVLSGDVPLLSLATLQRLVSHHRSHDSCATVLTAEVADPTGYGRVVRNPDATVSAIVEHKDATPAQRRICEINSGIYVFRSGPLFDVLKTLTPSNAQNEYYLTDVIGIMQRKGMSVAAVKAPSALEIQGINTVEQLEEARSHMASQG